MKKEVILEVVKRLINKLIDLTALFDENQLRKQKIPVREIEASFKEVLVDYIKIYKDDHVCLYEKYKSESIWKNAFDEAFDTNESDWYIKQYDLVPNVLLNVYIDHHPDKAFYVILEMFIKGENDSINALKINARTILLDTRFEKYVKEALEVIEFGHSSTPGYQTGIVNFLVWLYEMKPKYLEKYISSFETDDDEIIKSVAQKCREQLLRNSKVQLSMEIH